MNTDSYCIENQSRRDVLKAGAALTLAVFAPRIAGAAMETRRSTAAAAEWMPNAFVRIAADDTVTVISKSIEMGQGAYTGLSTLIAEELDADWAQIRLEGAPVDPSRYGNPALGGVQGTGGSTSIASSYDQMRKAGATARAMLVSAAAAKWNVPAAQITVAKGVVTHQASAKNATFGELAHDASKLPVPKDVTLKDPAKFVLVGTPRPRVDSRAKSTGTAQFTQDIKLPGMLTAVVIHPPRFGGKVKGFDAAKAKAVPGVVDVVQFATPVRSGVAVLATDFWTAKKARELVTVDWDESDALKKSSSDFWSDYKKLASQPGLVTRKDGDVEHALTGAARTFEAAYEFPFLSHASMEPLNCVVQIGEGSCEIWNGDQLQSVDQPSVAGLLGITPDKVKINMLYAGGSFGRRGNPKADYVLEAAAIAKAANTKAPVKMVWTREDDMKAGFYRPMYYHTLKAGVDKSGRIVSWQQRIVGQSIMAGTPFAGGKYDSTSVEGAANLPYAIPNMLVDLHTTDLKVPVQWWRSVGSTHTAYSTECFLDDIARGLKVDPYELRHSLLEKHDRHRKVLELVAEKSGWKTPLAAGRARGIALHESFNTVVAQVAEVSRQADGFKVERVVCAVDCGVAVNPNIVAMQMEGGIGYGLSAAAMGAITIKDGMVEQANFNDYSILRINQMPHVEVHILPSTNKPTGVGEPGTPVIAPAVANAIAALTGKPTRALPFSAHGIQLA